MRLPGFSAVPRTRIRGFTLIELMIVVVIVAILGAIANAGYGFAVVKSRRSAAKGCVMEGAQYMERFYTTQFTYASTTLPPCSSDVTSYYTVSFSGTPDATTYTVQAAPQGTQAAADTKCGTLSINQAGVKNITGTDTVASCW